MSRVNGQGYVAVWDRAKGRYRPEHVLVWEDANGPVPTGYIVHHKDENRQNNVLTNLQLMTRSEHHSHHRHRLGTGVGHMEGGKYVSGKVCPDCGTPVGWSKDGGRRCRSCARKKDWQEGKYRV